MLNNILLLIKRNNITEHKLLAECGLALSSMSIWKSGKAKPSYDALIKIADYFGVSIDYLVGRESPAVAAPMPQTSPDLQRIIDAWPRLTEGQRTIFRTQMDVFEQSASAAKPPKKKVGGAE